MITITRFLSQLITTYGAQFVDNVTRKIEFILQQMSSVCEKKKKLLSNQTFHLQIVN